VRFEAVPLDAVPASLGLASWVETGDRHLAYRCIVTPRADGRWSGRSAIAPSGWSLGGGSGDRRVCRYVADADGSGAIDANIEHPADYVDVAGALLAQNFLVVRGDQACPAGSGDDVVTAGILTQPHPDPDHVLNDCPYRRRTRPPTPKRCARRSRSPARRRPLGAESARRLRHRRSRRSRQSAAARPRKPAARTPR
jgi:hypothetical protein